MQLKEDAGDGGAAEAGDGGAAEGRCWRWKAMQVEMAKNKCWKPKAKNTCCGSDVLLETF